MSKIPSLKPEGDVGITVLGSLDVKSAVVFTDKTPKNRVVIDNLSEGDYVVAEIYDSKGKIGLVVFNQDSECGQFYQMDMWTPDSHSIRIVSDTTEQAVVATLPREQELFEFYRGMTKRKITAIFIKY
jgi:hypothetical protein